MPALNKELLETVLNDFNKNYQDFDYFIESGTYLGETTKIASLLFKKVITVEVFERLFREAKAKFENTNVECYIGETHKLLESILSNIKGNTFFWLDGHNSGPGTGYGDLDFPLLLECKMIDEFIESKESIVMIDDIRMFGVGHENEIDDTLKTITIEQVFDCFKKRKIKDYKFYASELSKKDRLAIFI